MKILEILQILKQKKWAILLPAIVAGLLTFLYFKIVPQDKFLVLEIDTQDIVSLEGKGSNEKFSLRDFKKFEKMNIYDLSIKKHFTRTNTLLEDKLIDYFIVRKKIGENETPQIILSDFFSKIDKILFKMFISKLKKDILLNNRNLYKMKLSLDELKRKVEIVKKYSRGNDQTYIAIDSMASMFLPPTQQLNGYLISWDTLNNRILQLSEIQSLGNKLLKKIDNMKIRSFRELLKLPNVVIYRKIYIDYEFIPKIIDILLKKYSTEWKIEDNGKNCLKFTFLVFSLILAIQIFMVSFLHEIRSELNKG